MDQNTIYRGKTWRFQIFFLNIFNKGRIWFHERTTIICMCVLCVTRRGRCLLKDWVKRISFYHFYSVETVLFPTFSSPFSCNLLFLSHKNVSHNKILKILNKVFPLLTFVKSIVSFIINSFTCTRHTEESKFSFISFHFISIIKFYLRCRFQLIDINAITKSAVSLEKQWDIRESKSWNWFKSFVNKSAWKGQEAISCLPLFFLHVLT